MSGNAAGRTGRSVTRGYSITEYSVFNLPTDGMCVTDLANLHLSGLGLLKRKMYAYAFSSKV